MKPYILVVEDEEAISVMIEYNLKSEGFEVQVVDDGEKALWAVDERLPDLIVLDWMLPMYDGVEVCRRLREIEESRLVPIIMLTARGEEEDRVLGLKTGADDYVVKPFSPNELIARINAVLRRTRPVLQEKKIEFHGLTIDLKSHKVKFEGHLIHLGPTEFKLLAHLMENAGQVYSREQLLDRVWGRDVYVEERTVDVHIRRLRKALDGVNSVLGTYIRTIRSAGYMMELPEEY
jgi:two-component system phosphate regulon response regulator PhoB